MWTLQSGKHAHYPIRHLLFRRSRYSLFGAVSVKTFGERRRRLARSLGLLLLLLLHPLYLGPHQVSRLALHLDRIALLRVVEFQ